MLLPPTDCRIEFVTVARCWYSVDAWLVRNRLASEGLAAIVVDDNFGVADWSLVNAIGGIKVQVLRGDVEEALRVIARDDSQNLPPLPRRGRASGLPRCKHCGSTELVEQRCSRRAAFMSWILLGVPLPMGRRFKECLECGHATPSPLLDEKGWSRWLMIALLIGGLLFLMKLSITAGMQDTSNPYTASHPIN